MSDYALLMAHPSICSERESKSHNDLLKCHPHSVLRYTTAVDIIAPAFDFNFFQHSVVPTLEMATYGVYLSQVQRCNLACLHMPVPAIAFGNAVTLESCQYIFWTTGAA